MVFVIGGTYFGMDADGSGIYYTSERTAISQFNGVMVDGVTTTTSHRQP